VLPLHALTSLQPIMSYQAPPGPKHANSSYSSASSDPFNPSVQQLPYGESPSNPYAAHGAPNPGAGGAGVAPPMSGGQYAPMYDTESEMAHRYDGGGVGRETYMSDAGWSQSGESAHSVKDSRLILDVNDKYGGSSDYQHQNYMPSRASTPTFTEGSKDGHRPREPYVRRASFCMCTADVSRLGPKRQTFLSRKKKSRMS